MEELTEAQKIVAQLIASASLADHMGDMWDDLRKAADIVGLKDPGIGSDEAREWAKKNKINTVWDTALGED